MQQDGSLSPPNYDSHSFTQGRRGCSMVKTSSGRSVIKFFIEFIYFYYLNTVMMWKTILLLHYTLTVYFDFNFN